MSKNLCIDIGNTRTKLALYSAEVFISSETYKTITPESILAHATNQKVENIILSNVGIEWTQKQIELFYTHFFFINLDHTTHLPIAIDYDTPETLGIDRIAALAGGLIYGDESAIGIIDAGTCITMDILDKNHTFIGGNISPGVRMRLNAMHSFTKRLPQLEPEDTINALGRSTKEAMLNGAQAGAIIEVSAFMRQMKEKFDKIKFILTGGDAYFFEKHLKKEIFVLPNLVLDGLNKILIHNVDKKSKV